MPGLKRMLVVSSQGGALAVLGVVVFSAALLPSVC
jgi:hypothetical protein